MSIFRRTICIDITIINLSKGSRDVDCNSRRYIHHVPFNMYVILIQLYHSVTNHLAHGRHKRILFDSFKLWEEIISMVKVLPRPFRTIHGL
jgi:hypothetical protein